MGIDRARPARKSVHGQPALPRAIESAWAVPIPQPDPTPLRSQARVLTADIHEPPVRRGLGRNPCSPRSLSPSQPR